MGQGENEMATKSKYFVYYGSNTSRQTCYNLAEVNSFIAYCLREGTPITGVTKA